MVLVQSQSRMSPESGLEHLHHLKKEREPTGSHASSHHSLFTRPPCSLIHSLSVQRGLFWTSPINAVMQHVTFCICLASSLSIMFTRLVHVLARVSASFLCVALCGSRFIYPFITWWAHAAVNPHVHTWVWTRAFNSLICSRYLSLIR